MHKTGKRQGKHSHTSKHKNPHNYNITAKIPLSLQ